MSTPTAEQIDSYEQAATQIAQAIAGLNAAQLQYIPTIGDWSIHEIVIHLADSEAVGYWRLRRTLAEKGSTLTNYDEEAWARNLSYRIQDLQLALQLFQALRASSAALLRLLPEEAWERTSEHETRGVLSMSDIFATYLEHAELHLQQIERLKSAYAAKH